MKMTWEYIAGFFDGEGCITLHSNRTNGAKVYKIQISQANVLVLERIKDFLLENRIYCRVYKDGHWYKEHCKRLCINGYNDVLKFLENIKDKCIVKEQKANDAYNIMFDYRPSHVWTRDWNTLDAIKELIATKGHFEG